MTDLESTTSLSKMRQEEEEEGFENVSMVNEKSGLHIP